VPVAHHHRGGNINTSGKGLRLFRFDIECDSSSPASPQATMPNHSTTTTSWDHPLLGKTQVPHWIDKTLEKSL